MSKTYSLVLAFILVPALAFGQQSTVIEEIVARVNNAIITRADLRRGEEQMVNEVHQQSPDNADEIVKQREKNVLRDLIDQQLMLQKAQELNISADVDLVKRLDEIRKQMGASSMEDMEKIAQQQGVSFEDFKQNLKNSIITQRVISQEVGSRIQIGQADIKKYYDDHRTELERPEQVRLSEVLVTAGSDPEAASAAQAKADDLLKQLHAGASFPDLARKNSQGPTAAQGGDLGYFKRGMLAQELESKTFGLKAGETTDVIRTKQGFVILEVTEHTQAGLPPLEKIQGQIQEALYVQRIQPALREYLTKLREEAYIDVRQGFVDTGASAKESKPEFTTGNNDTTNDTVAKNKKKKHFLFF